MISKFIRSTWLFTLCSGLFLVIASCSTVLPFPSFDAAIANSNQDFTILGVVSVNTTSLAVLDLQSSGIKTLLLTEAKRTYPEADMVVDITPTGIVTKGIFGTTRTYIVEGTVIKFNN